MDNNLIPVANLPRTMFNGSCSHKFTGTMGKVYPFYALDCVPGDVIDLRTAYWLNFQPMLAPCLEDIIIRQAFFFIPYRILDDNFESIATMAESIGVNSIDNSKAGVNAGGVFLSKDSDGNEYTIAGAARIKNGADLKIPRWYVPDDYHMVVRNQSVSMPALDWVVLDNAYRDVELTSDFALSKGKILRTTAQDFPLSPVLDYSKPNYIRDFLGDVLQSLRKFDPKTQFIAGFIWESTFSPYNDEWFSNFYTIGSDELNKHKIGSLWDCFGFPVNKVVPSADNAPIDYLRRAYYAVWNEYFRDDRLQYEVDVKDVRNDKVLNCCWEKDIFTSATLQQQLGVAPALPVSGVMPLSEIYTYAYGENVPANVVVKSPAYHWHWGDKGQGFSSDNYGVPRVVSGDSWSDQVHGASNAVVKTAVAHRAGFPPLDPDGNLGSNGVTMPIFHDQPTATEQNNGCYDVQYTPNKQTLHDYLDDSTIHLHSPNLPPGGAVMTAEQYAANPMTQLGVKADNLATFDIADIRLASALQRWRERNSHVGIRYVDYLKANYGVFPRDDRMQRPEMIGQSRKKLVSNPVVQTAVDTSEKDATPVGTRYGNLSGGGNDYIGRYRVQEFGCIIGVCWVKPRSNYVAQGINRQWLKSDCYDLFNPIFIHVSDEEIMNEELYLMSEGDTYAGEVLTRERAAQLNKAAWGFRPRYQYMREGSNLITGNFRELFDYWHFGRKFDTLPNLTGEFVDCVPTKRPFAVQDEDTILFDLGTVVKMSRPLPVTSVPSLS